jgi:hypothetical protein
MPKSIYPHSKYPKYIHGNFYAVNREFAAKLVTALEGRILWPVEDAQITGLMADELNATRRDVGGIGYGLWMLARWLMKGSFNLTLYNAPVALSIEEGYGYMKLLTTLFDQFLSKNKDHNMNL